MSSPFCYLYSAAHFLIASSVDWFAESARVLKSFSRRFYNDPHSNTCHWSALGNCDRVVRAAHSNDDALVSQLRKLKDLKKLSVAIAGKPGYRPIVLQVLCSRKSRSHGSMSEEGSVAHVAELIGLSMTASHRRNSNEYWNKLKMRDFFALGLARDALIQLSASCYKPRSAYAL